MSGAVAVRMDGDTEYLRGLAVPFDEPTRVGERINGHLRVYRETFDADSFVNLPERVPLTQRHDIDAPVGWARLRISTRGLEAEGELIDTQAARDLVKAIRAGLLTGLSIGFIGDDNRDVWTRGANGGDRMPSVVRRGVRLDHLALVASPAYPSARVASVGRRSWQADADAELIKAVERTTGPLRVDLAVQARVQREQDAELLADLRRLTESPPTLAKPAEVPLPASRLTDDVLVTLSAADGARGEIYRTAVLGEIRRRGRALSRDELAAVAREAGLLPPA